MEIHKFYVHLCYINYLCFFLKTKLQFLKQMYVLVLGLDVLGNPFGLIRGLSEGVEAFFYEPFQVCCWCCVIGNHRIAICLASV